jgi:hypothetical protein
MARKVNASKTEIIYMANTIDDVRFFLDDNEIWYSGGGCFRLTPSQARHIAKKLIQFADDIDGARQ